MHVRGLHHYLGQRLVCGGCISIHTCVRIATLIALMAAVMLVDFNSCMCENCKLLLFGGRVAFVYFDSCMREDCNGDGGDKAKIKAILIHVCARIAISSAYTLKCMTGF